MQITNERRIIEFAFVHAFVIRSFIQIFTYDWIQRSPCMIEGNTRPMIVATASFIPIVASVEKGEETANNIVVPKPLTIRCIRLR